MLRRVALVRTDVSEEPGAWNSQVEEDKMARALTHMCDKRNAYRLLVGKSEMEEAARKTIILRWILKKCDEVV
jgi:hypothetical protein